MSYEELLHTIIKEDKRYVVMTAENRASLRNIPSLIEKNFVDTGISEMTLVGAAAGMAIRGRVPVVHALAAFLTMRSFEFIRTDVGYGNLPVKLVGSFAGFLSQANGPTHQAIEDMGLIAGIPGMGVFAPSDYDEMMSGLPEILTSKMPFYIRYNDNKTGIEHEPFKIGKAEVFGKGYDFALITTGIMLENTLKAAELLNKKGYLCRVINLRTLSPLDEATIYNAALECNTLVTVEDHFIQNGLFSIISNLLTKRRVFPEIVPVGLDKKWFKPLMLNEIMKYEGFMPEDIVKKILNKIN